MPTLDPMQSHSQLPPSVLDGNDMKDLLELDTAFLDKPGSINMLGSTAQISSKMNTIDSNKDKNC